MDSPLSPEFGVHAPDAASSVPQVATEVPAAQLAGQTPQVATEVPVQALVVHKRENVGADGTARVTV